MKVACSRDDLARASRRTIYSMIGRNLATAGLLLGLFTTPTLAAPPASQPAELENGWASNFFNYERPHAVTVEELTPTAAQLDWHSRPPQLPTDTPAPVAPSKPVAPAVVGGMQVVHIRFRDMQGQDVPALLCTPKNSKGPFPLVVALHGLTSNKAQVCAQIATDLTQRGFAVLAPDLPMHGERRGDPHQFIDRQQPLRCVDQCQQAVLDVRQCIDMAETRPELDTGKGVILLGYSIGSLIDSVAGAADDRVRAMALLVGGTPDFPPAMSLIPQLAALQPQLAIAHFAGRPLLMLNGEDDTTITRDMGKRLYAAAAEPKRQVWYKSGHRLPRNAYTDAADWVAQTWKALSADAPAEKASAE